MNQILITGDEKVKKEKKPLPINVIVAFYAICIMILGICMISGSVYAKGKINEVVEANKEPEISINKNEDDSTVEIHVSHVRGIKTIEYKWNDEEATVIDGENQKEVIETIDLLGGTNVLTVIVTEENGKKIQRTKQFISGNIPKIELEAVANGIKIIASSEKEIDYITYSWDDVEAEKITVGKTEYEGIINAPQGKHTLKIEVVDINKGKATKIQTVVGDTAPTVNITANRIDGKVLFIVNVEDDQNITTVEITHNEGQKQVINVNEKIYYKEIEMVEGENKIMVTAYNENGLSTTLRRKVQNNK